MKIINTAAMHQYGIEDYSFGYITKTRKGFEIRFVAGFPPVVCKTLLEAQQFIFNVHPMAYVGQVGRIPDNAQTIAEWLQSRQAA